MDTADFVYEAALLEDEMSRVLAWRERRLIALGYPSGEATFLACAPVDIHDVERLIVSGCPLDLAIKIAE
jgi:hypothetical protein